MNVLKEKLTRAVTKDSLILVGKGMHTQVNENNIQEYWSL